MAPKSKLTDDIQEKPKDEDVIDFSKESHDEARESLLKIIKDNEMKKVVYFG